MLRGLIASSVLSLFLGASGLNAKPQPFTPGQYQIGDPAIQQICLKDDGSWFGTTFDFGGVWLLNPLPGEIDAAIFGNYKIVGHNRRGYANDTITIGILKKHPRIIVADWYDWFNDHSFVNVLAGQAVIFVKSDCDPPFSGENTHAATQ